ncbi:hypothetical protein HMF8227_02178 [Saliniradius amylolyticus]|uniref:Uncharacterized protein n=1 Tax=Saliniradius amylolyticus TaxID=2183582 RepID=A0A2S2E4Q1_9ALTE|nr:hypothetical protein [Saliniradius amylolyticus]AWL12636.1 hypothetical protein HMF8227_02178 [Saliniradius amylolyticus]
MSNSDFEQKLQRQIDELPREKHPERDLWTGIERGIQHKAEQRIVSPLWRNAAAVAFVGVLGFGAMEFSGLRVTTDSPMQQLTQQHQSQKRFLLASLDNQPALTDNWQQQLAELEAAAEAIKQALEEDPNNVALLKMLQQVYQQQIDLIEKVHAPKWRQV